MDIIVPVASPETVQISPPTPQQQIIVNNAGLKGDNGRDGADSTVPGPPGPPGSVSGYFDVTTYGAIGNGVFDCTAAFQQAISAAGLAGGGTVFVPSGNYLVSDQLLVHTGISILGQGSEASTITQSDTTKDLLVGVDAASIGLRGLLLQGPGSGTGKGINFTWSTTGNVPFMNFTDIKIHDFGDDAMYMQTAIVSSFIDVVAKDNGGWGFNFEGGTSCTFDACWAEDNLTGGYQFHQSVYMSLNACASDGNPVGYFVDGCSGIAFNGCGNERGAVGVKVNASSAIGFHSCWNYDNRNIAYWVTGSSSGIEFYSCQEAAPNGSATACFQYDSGSRGLLSSPGAVTANVLTGTVTVIDDINGLATLPLLAVNGIADFYGNSVNIHGTSGKLLLSANADGGAYNMFVDTTGVLAFYGSSTATLNLELLDGYLQLDTLTATTVPYTDGNKRFASSVVTPTELAYLSGVTSAIQTQFGLKAPLASPALTGTPTAPTATLGTNTTQIATTAFVIANAGAGGFTNPMTTLGDIIYENATPAAARLAGNTTTTKQYLSQTGNGTISAAPAWAQIAIGDLSGLGTGVATFLGTPSSANLASAITDETGSGLLVFATAPAFTTSITMSAANIITDTTTGMKIGTATSQKLGFFNATPIVQVGATIDLGVVLSNLGLRAAGTAYTITTSGAVILTGAVQMNATTLATDTTTGLQIGTSSTQKLSFFGATRIVQPGATVDLATVLSNLGLRASGTAFPLTTTATISAGLYLSPTVAATVTTNAATLAVTSGNQKFTNSSAAAMTLTLATASAIDGQSLIVRIYDFSATAEGITWVNTENSTISAPTTSNGSTTLPLTVGFIFNGSTSKWRCVAVA